MSLSVVGQMAAAEAGKYSTLEEFKSKTPEIYWYAEKAGILDKITGHMKHSEKVSAQNKFANEDSDPSKEQNIVERNIATPQTTVGKWDHRTVKEEALKYQFRNHFRRQSAGAYKYAERNNILGEVTDHMQKKIIIKWNHALVKTEALKYKVKDHFKYKSGGAFGYARKHGLIDEICSHMVGSKKAV